MANLLAAAGANRVMTMDLHAAQIQGFFDIPVDNLDASVIFVPYLRSLGLEHLTIASPDIGGALRARFFAQAMNVEVVICEKKRKRANAVVSLRVIGAVKDHDNWQVDDNIDTAGQLTKA